MTKVFEAIKMKPCRPLRQGDQMQCHCGLAWDIGEEKPKCVNDKPEISEQVPLFVLNSCKVCGEPMEGDGYNTPLHCPNVDADGYEPDCNPLYCYREPRITDDDDE